MDRPQVFRVFVSSTFKDLAAERNLLQAEVFPRLREFCQSLGARFQPIDLRWGVSGEASLDQQAMNICLAEIRRCREVTPRPNFIVLLGNRRGWLAPPPQIPAAEFEQIRDQVTVTSDRELLATWYIKDGNAVPAEYCLRARTGDLGSYRDQSKWENEVEGPLGAILGKAASEIDLPAAGRLKYSASATEQEIEAGALAAGDASGHAFAFIRELTGPYPAPAEAAAEDPILEFADKDQEPLDALKSRLSAALPVKTYQAQWDARLGRPTSGHLAALARDVEEALRGAILAQLAQQAKAMPRPGRMTAHPALAAEGLAHRDFAQERAKIFVGREDSLTAVAQYLKATDPRPLAITGEGGSGKSALLAEALCRAQADHPGADLVYRFIGVTPDSSQGRSLLRGLCLELARRGYGSAEATVPTSYPDLVTDFRQRLGHARPGRPLIMFLDSLDQLFADQGARELTWLPAPLPAEVRMVLSARPDDVLQALVRSGALVRELERMSQADGRELLRRWLDAVRRRLTTEQETGVLAGFAASDGNPLYLRLAFEEARRWRSADRPDPLGVGSAAIIRQGTFARLAEEDRHGAVLVSHALGYIAASRHGVTEDELIDLLSRDPEVYEWFLRGAHHIPPDLATSAEEYHGAAEPSDRWLEHLRTDPCRQDELRRFLEQVLSAPDGPRLPIVLWSRLAFDLRPYLTERGAEEAVLIGFFHRELAEAAVGAYLGGSQAARYHGKLADYFRSPLDADGRRAWAGAPLHALSELPYHLASAGAARLADLEDTLTDFGFLEAKASRVGVQRDENGEPLAYAGVYQLQEDFDLAQAAMRGGQVASRGPVVVTATDVGGGPVVRCPYCGTQREIAPSSLTDGRITCLNEACGQPLAVNPFVVSRPARPAAAAKAAAVEAAVPNTADLVVGLAGPADYRTITAAVSAAEPGARIVVGPGVYRESVLLERSVELVADGPSGDVVIEAADGACVVLRAHHAVVRGFTLRTLPSATGKFSGVQIASGQPLLEDCDISSGSESCVAVYGPANPTIRACRIHDGAMSGIDVFDEGAGVIEDCDIWGNKMAGVEVRTGGKPTVQACRIHDGDSSGMRFHDKSKGLVEDCDIWGNGRAGVDVGYESDPTIRACRIHDGQEAGVYVWGNSAGVIEDCEIWGNGRAGVEIKTFATPTVRACRIRDGASAGIAVHDEGAGVIEDCEIWGNEMAGLDVSGGASPSVRGCRIHGGAGPGVMVYAQGAGVIEDCDIWDNKLASMAIHHGGDPTVRACQIHDSPGIGVLILDEGKGTIEDCAIWGNAQADVHAVDDSHAVIRRCEIGDGSTGASR